MLSGDHVSGSRSTATPGGFSAELSVLGASTLEVGLLLSRAKHWEALELSGSASLLLTCGRKWVMSHEQISDASIS